jgi:hypothetical protein
MQIKMGDLVQINCKVSKYHGVMGESFAVQHSTQYAIVDMPKGTEARIERLLENAIIEKMKRAEKTRKAPFSRWPKGDPEWLPLAEGRS